MRQKYIFIDLDETLIYADMMRFGNSTELQLSDGSKYYGVLRKTTLELLASLRSIAPCFMLTTSTWEYGMKWNDGFNLGFQKNEIYDRINIYNTVNNEYSRTDLKTTFSNAQSYLIDNLHIYDNKAKLAFLSMIDSAPKYFRISPYFGVDAVAVDEHKQIVDFINE